MDRHNKDVPVFKLFSHKGKYYFYDTYTNGLFEVLEEHYTELYILKQMGITEYINLHKNTKAYQDILILINRGMLKCNFISKVQHPQTEKIPYLLGRCINYMILQVTQNCNFRCRYCLYAGESKVERKHEDVEMPWSVAKAAIDFLYLHSMDANDLNIAFYGGEPLLNYSLIKKSVEYAENKFTTKKIHYSMTINASLLSETIIEFLIRYSIDISISLDGPENIQNSHRKFGKTGGGTYNSVIKNIESIKRINKEYFRKHVFFLPVIIDDENVEEVMEFYSSIGVEKEKITPLQANLSGVDYILSEIKLDCIGKKERGMLRLYDHENDNIENLLNKKGILPSVWHHNGQCIPGVERVFVDVNGEFFPCEKITEDKCFSIGNIDEGFNLDRVKTFLNLGKITEESCKGCWALRLCEMCVSSCNDVDVHMITSERKLIACTQQKSLLLNKIKDFVDSNV